MKKETITCDKCGAEISTFQSKYLSAKIELWSCGENRYKPGQRIDLCESCFNKFIAFLEGGENA